MSNKLTGFIINCTCLSWRTLKIWPWLLFLITWKFLLGLWAKKHNLRVFFQTKSCFLTGFFTEKLTIHLPPSTHTQSFVRRGERILGFDNVRGLSALTAMRPQTHRAQLLGYTTHSWCTWLEQARSKTIWILVQQISAHCTLLPLRLVLVPSVLESCSQFG